MKKYNQPTTEIIAVNTEYMMEGDQVSVNPSGGGGTAGMPGLKGDVIE